MNTLTYNEWYDMSYQHALTIKDIMQLEPGQRINVLSLDRNVFDIALREEIRGKSLRPEEFFESNWAVYIHAKDLTGKIIFEFQSGKYDMDYDFNLNDMENFEFEIEYDPEHKRWYPLKDGKLPASDPQQYLSFPWKEEQDWTNFPDNTRVGFRGPMILWSKLKDMPNVIYPFSKNILNAFEKEEHLTSDRQFTITTDNNDINTVCNDVYKRMHPKSVARAICWDIIDKLEMVYPIEFNATVNEITPNSKQLSYNYHVTLKHEKMEYGEKTNIKVDKN